MKILLQVILMLFPWAFRRLLLNKFLKFNVSNKAYIGFTIITAETVVIEKQASIGHFNVIRNLKKLHLAEGAIIGTMNWIAGGLRVSKESFRNAPNRNPSLFLKEGAAITHQHLIDCTDYIEIGKMTTIAGYRSTFLTHGIDVKNCKQTCKPIIVGDYCLVGSSVTILMGAELPSNSVLGACSLLLDEKHEENSLICGVPAKQKKNKILVGDYFNRKTAKVD